MAARYAALAVLFVAAGPAAAVDRITASIDELQAGGITAREIRAQLDIASADHSVATVTVAALDLPAALRAQTGAVTSVALRCADPVVAEPRFRCADLALSARAARLPPLALRGPVELRSDTGRVTASGSGPTVAGKALRYAIEYGAQGWSVRATLPQVAINALRGMLAPWFALPADLTLDGRMDATLSARGNATLESASVSARISALNLQNKDATIIGEKVDFSADVQLRGTPAALQFETRLQGTAGQFLGGPVLLDFNSNRLDATARGSLEQATLRVDRFDATQRTLSAVHGDATVQLQPFSVQHARVELESLQFPAAYSSFMQITLATTPFGTLMTAGKASGALTIVANLPTQLDLRIEDLNLQDDSRQLQVTGVDGELHWAAGATGPPRPSRLSWESARGWNIEGGKSRIDFATQDRDFRLLSAARLPFFDGAMVIDTLEARNIGSDRLEGAFDATIEPISMTRISTALGLPEFSGVLAGRIPGLTYKDGLLTVQGNVEAQVFDGRVTASNLRVRDPLGAWPRLYGDIEARNLDLDLITRTFEFGGITGRLDGDIRGLETFNWSPVAFDMKLATPPGDRSRHRISQKAVKNLSNIGGGGGGVAAALQSGALRFFEQFHYDRIGLSCKLKDDVCQMDGVAPAKAGYYIVKGSGIPRIDIIGNQSRVDWPLLMAQISAAVANSGDIVVD